jgi:hypothetical protein
VEVASVSNPQSEPGATCPSRGDSIRRSKRLLEENLTPEQREQYASSLCFDVIGGLTGRRYRLWERQHQNIEELDPEGRRRCIWCVGPIGGLPIGDVLLAQKIALELFEPCAIRIANKYSEFAPEVSR